MANRKSGSSNRGIERQTPKFPIFASLLRELESQLQQHVLVHHSAQGQEIAFPNDSMQKRISPVILAKHSKSSLDIARVLSACLSTLTAIFLPAIATSQSITSDGSTGTIVTPNNNPTPPGTEVYDITGGQLSQDGQNLFHSFGQFGLGTNQTANFIVPADSAIANILGRVTGGNPSIINGLIQVTGGNPNLFLMNPAGIIFGANAQLNVPADFTATTATRIGLGNNNWFDAVGTNDFAALTGPPSTFAFGTPGTPGAIVNAGQLAVQDGKNLSLLGGTVVSTGQLRAPGGKITVAAVPGENLIRISLDNHLLNLEIQPCSGNCTPTDLSNASLPNPLSLPQLLTGRPDDVDTGLTVNANQEVLTPSGIVIPQSPGTAVISGDASPPADASITTSSSQIGGSVQLRGSFIGLVEGVQIDASGTTGGGNVLIGSDFRGQNTVSNDLRTFVGSDVTINADATSGNGGEIRVFSGNTTRFLGSVSTRGGNGGNGGFVGILGTENLTFSGIADTSAQNGNRGTLLLSSGNLTLTDAAASATPTSPVTDISQILLSDNSIGSNTISWGQIAELATNNNITLEGTGAIAIADVVGNTPSVTQNNLVNLGQNTGNLTLRSTKGAITFNDPNDTIQTSGSALTLEALTNITAGNLLTNGGAVTLNSATGSITTRQIDTSSPSTNGGAITLNAQTGNITTLDINASSISRNGGTVTLNAPKGSIASGHINTSSRAGDGGRASLNSQKDISVNFIDTRSLGNGTGGNIEITTSNLFRATGTNSSNASLSTTGGTRGGSISIRHGGGTLGVPFTVGSEYNGKNGTAGAISTGTTNQITSRVFPSSDSLGNPPSDIQILTQGNQPLPLPQIQVVNQTQPVNSSSQQDSSSQSQNNTNTVPPAASSPSPVEIDTGFTEVEESFTQDFEQYFDRNFTAASQTITQARDTLQQIDRVTGVKPALIYAVFAPATIDPQATTVGQKPQPTDQLELLLVTSEGKTVRKRVEGATRDRVLRMALEFRNSVTNLRSPHDYLSSAQQLYKWLVEPLEVELQAQKIDNLVFLVDSGLRSIPIAALHDTQGFLVERYSVALMPSLNLTDTRYRNIQKSQILAMGAETFPDQKPLPAVPVELSVITQQLWRGKAFLNSAFTLENLKAQRKESSFSIIHLATHADFLPGTPENSYIQLGDGKLRLNQMPQLNWRNPPVELLVLSACRTAVGNEQAELGFAGLAVHSGVKSAMASLWVVSDEATLGLMTQFYRQLKSTPIKAEALRQAQLAMLKGSIYIKSGKLYTPQGEIPLPPELKELSERQLTHPYFWAAFTMIGNPW